MTANVEALKAQDGERVIDDQSKGE